jgi:hypothetical protein
LSLNSGPSQRAASMTCPESGSAADKEHRG